MVGSRTIARGHRLRRRLAVLVVATAAFAGCAPQTTGAPAGPDSTVSGIGGPAPVTVVSITDGDTFRVHTATDAAGASTPIRLIGIDAPELRPVRCYGPEATAELSALIPVGSEVHLVYDKDRVDRYDRVLAYVEVVGRDGQTVDVGESMVGRGAAIAKRYPPNTSRAEVLERSQASAEANRLGLWGACP